MRTGKALDQMFYGTVTVGERGQVVIPAKARAEQDINAGEKLLVFAHPADSGISLVKMSGMAEFVETLKAVLDLAEQNIPEEQSHDVSQPEDD
jgi:AbrB family looped-hinge helix DNA binding protein